MHWLLFTLACGGCDSPPPHEPHYLPALEAWHAAIRCDPRLARERARELQVPPEWSAEREARAEGLHGAAAWLMIAESCDELAEGAALLADGCGQCHRAEGLPAAPRAEPRKHQQLEDALWTAWSESGRAPELPADLEALAPPGIRAVPLAGALRGLREAPHDLGALERTLATCSDCHQTALQERLGDQPDPTGRPADP